jgi:hypothetical protein
MIMEVAVLLSEKEKIKHPSAVMKRASNKRCNIEVAVLPSGKEKIKTPCCCDEES